MWPPVHPRTATCAGQTLLCVGFTTRFCCRSDKPCVLVCSLLVLIIHCQVYPSAILTFRICMQKFQQWQQQSQPCDNSESASISLYSHNLRLCAKIHPNRFLLSLRSLRACNSFTHPPPPGSRPDSSWGQCWSGTCTSPGQSPLLPWHVGTTCGGHCASRRSDGSSWSRD